MSFQGVFEQAEPVPADERAEQVDRVCGRTLVLQRMGETRLTSCVDEKIRRGQAHEGRNQVRGVIRQPSDWLEGAHAQAEQAWQKSLAQAEALGMKYEVALAHYEWGRHLRAEEREAHLTQARAQFELLGAAYDVARAEAALD